MGDAYDTDWVVLITHQFKSGNAAAFRRRACLPMCLHVPLLGGGNKGQARERGGSVGSRRTGCAVSALPVSRPLGRKGGGPRLPATTEPPSRALATQRRKEGIFLVRALMVPASGGKRGGGNRTQRCFCKCFHSKRVVGIIGGKKGGERAKGRQCGVVDTKTSSIHRVIWEKGTKRGGGGGGGGRTGRR